ncbi:ly6/PLAUR domain-containing protein 1 isoform X2 [Pantherophis guttatus]|uniref:Ly6/PLAUR domain-containing protein 1 isoform X2 n=1 Tax=Pantherophis guttatus TaxID=94885 RepID=A0A6P9C8P0_PANGU|nr:ly6/PLAUR domain-containing protein 1 isoform X2 [Pantherophis guttatus]
MWLLAVTTTFWGLLLAPGFALQIQCYQCEEFQLNNDCSAPEFIVNCTVNVQDMCQKEVMEKSSERKQGTMATLTEERNLIQKSIGGLMDSCEEHLSIWHDSRNPDNRCCQKR